jgi:hypothetical protein
VSVVVIGQPSLLVGRLPRGRVVLGHRGTDCWRGPSRAPSDPGPPGGGLFRRWNGWNMPIGIPPSSPHYAVLLRHQPPATGAAKTPEQTVEIAEVLTVVAQDPSRRKSIDR